MPLASSLMDLSHTLPLKSKQTKFGETALTDDGSSIGINSASPQLELRIPLSSDNFDRLQALQQTAGFDEMADLFNEAVRLFEWAVEQKGTGHQIGAAVDGRFLEKTFQLSTGKGGSRSR